MSVPVDSFITVADSEQRFRDLIINGTPQRVGRVDFVFIEGDTFLEEDADFKYNQQAVLGRPGEYVNFVGSQAREFRMTLKFHGTESTLDEVLRPVSFFQAVRAPWYVPNDPSSPTMPPPRLRLRLGDFLDVICRVTDCTERWMRPVWTVNPDGFTGFMTPHACEMQVTFTSLEFRIANDVV